MSVIKLLFLLYEKLTVLSYSLTFFQLRLIFVDSKQQLPNTLKKDENLEVIRLPQSIGVTLLHELSTTR